MLLMASSLHHKLRNIFKYQYDTKNFLFNWLVMRLKLYFRVGYKFSSLLYLALCLLFTLLDDVTSENSFSLPRILINEILYIT